ncbi:MAG: tRNA dihydrouridine synthase DusB [Treponemataceae bacterium]|nr:MAG: tRNA dihydrouridine synthase DusB [Treponemataceae bacterium]
MSFYHPVTIGNVSLGGNLFMAPVAGYSDAAFRSVCIAGGADFTYTEMVSAEAMVRDSAKTLSLLTRAPNETRYAVQLFGGKPESVARAAVIVCEKFSPAIIDINAGCPVPKIIKSGSGAFLTKNPDMLYKIVSATVKAVQPVPVTVKIRSGWDAANITYMDAAAAAFDAGAAALTCHPRTRSAGYEGKADWAALKALTERFGETPIFGSGDVFTPHDALRMLETTGVAGVMFARGALQNPFVFAETKALLQTGTYTPAEIEVRIKAAFEQLTLLIEMSQNETDACLKMRKRFCAYLKGVPGSAELRRRITACSSAAEYREALGAYTAGE